MPMMTTAPATTGDHNQADVMFAQMMIPHHEQAIEMTELASTRASNADVKALAAQIQAAQQPEINEMRGWLASWGCRCPKFGSRRLTCCFAAGGSRHDRPMALRLI
jgi:uncharacterized protein (DUF305 family)